LAVALANGMRAQSVALRLIEPIRMG
jgi:hypothetical protein